VSARRKQEANFFAIGKAILAEGMTIGAWWTRVPKEQAVEDFGERVVRNSVAKVIGEGGDVPDEVLADYPDLAEAYRARKAVP